MTAARQPRASPEFLPGIRPIPLELRDGYACVPLDQLALGWLVNQSAVSERIRRI